MNAPHTPHLRAAEKGPTTPVTNAALWYQDAVIYQLNVKAFVDSNGDGVGDFQGVTSRLDYVKDLGVNTIWLMPFYPSPLKDDGYDIADYLDVNPQYGTLDDFKQMLDEAHKRDLKVITELVINHTSDQHPWFQAARKAPPGSPERDFYVWSDTDDKYRGTRIIFTDTETSNWTWDPVAKAYFWHRFFSHQPDLNFDNPRVLEAIFKVMRFWLDMGVDGFRLDAIPYLIEREGTNNENLPETHAIIKQLRAAIDANYPNRFLLAEANQWPEDVREYFGEGDECHMAYHFPLMPRMYMAIAQEDRYPLTEIMAQTPEIPQSCQWAIFLRNHDELTLEMVTSKERDYMYGTYAADPRARINLGIRRRLAPLMDNDIDRIKLMNSLLLSMRGSPIVYYGDEIGMGDNIFIGDRNGVRTPMQWSPDRNAGFSRADPQRLYLPPIMDAIYGYEAVNVESQLRDPSSLLHWMRRMLAVRGTSRAFGRGELLFLKPGNRKVLAYLRTFEDEVILCVANMARSAQPAELDLSAFKGRVPVELLGRTAFPPIGDLPYMLTLPKHGFYWFELSTDAVEPSWHQPMLPAEDRPVLVLFDGWNSIFRDQVVPWRIGLAVKTRAQFETDTLPRHIEQQRWYGAKGTALQRARLVDHAVWGDAERDALGRSDGWLLPLLELDGPAETSTYFVPLSLAWEDANQEGDEERYRMLGTAAIARVRQQAAVGVMGDAFADERFCRAVVAAMGQRRELRTANGTLRFLPTTAYTELAGADFYKLPVGRPQAASSNTIVTFGERLFLKGYRRVRPGVNPEFEVGRFLTEVANFPHCVPVVGVIEYRGTDGGLMTLGLLQAYVSNQGDGWAYTLAYLQRALDMQRTHGAGPEGWSGAQEAHGAYLALAETLGRRTGELHVAFTTPNADPAFKPEPLTGSDVVAWRDKTLAEARQTFAMLERALPQLEGATLADANTVLAAQRSLLDLISQAAAPIGRALKTRIHGDYHLAQVLLVRNDFVVIDFEGEPGRSFDERRARQSPLRDVAGMLRSFSYARAGGLRSITASADEMAQLVPFAAQWESAARSAFLRGYTAAVQGGALYESFDSQRGLLALFELEKALYELRYELNNRPDWVGIPLAGILGLMPR
ncbi:maltose alpha-D-glucosyltransferase [Piscinibacter gummiphilus]|uniref:maltose alpha-D-glucosyltransferase n=1 Tax=Piscinibacter gummiphilus TaxID=946333 RepID=A0ABZ0D0T0_9BURK|nr:maltose alpha-D-glucosyltransferase [Piscinibacter gummiphilus]WOB10818.1 maltose alpha-D-glucosyltransferase [Piscinibacter gummiphilus]